jgi:hypothetical protein
MNYINEINYINDLYDINGLEFTSLLSKMLAL